MCMISAMCEIVNSVVSPGDRLENVFEKRKTLKLGPGLRRDTKTNCIFVTSTGVLRYKEEPFANTYWIERVVTSRCYLPSRNDHTVGVIRHRRKDKYMVDIGTRDLARLSMYAFKRAVKGNRPDLKIGDIVYGKMDNYKDNYPPTITCTLNFNENKSLGELTNLNPVTQCDDHDFLITIKQKTVQNLLNGQLIDRIKDLGKSIQFEIAIGSNGKVWINSKSILDTLQVLQAIKEFDSS